MRNLSVMLCMAVMVGLAGFATAGGQSVGVPLSPADGWEKVSDGYWQRVTEEGKLQTVAMGPAGLEKVLDGLKNDLVRMVDEYLSFPDDEMLEVIQKHREHIAAVEMNLERSKQLKSIEILPAAWCEIDYDANAGGMAVCINYADAFASYYGSSAAQCFGLCDLYAYAYARRQLCNYNWVTQTESGSANDVINREVSADASLTSTAARECYSYGYAYVNCPDYSLYQSETDSSTSCGICAAACKDVAIDDVID